MNKEILKDYNLINIVDTYDWEDTKIVFYLNKKNDFQSFENLWNKIKEENDDLPYDDVLCEFDKVAKDKFDYIIVDFNNNSNTLYI